MRYLLFFLFFLPPLAHSQTNCSISDIDASVVDCIFGEFYVKLDFEYDNTSDSFTLNGNGISDGTYAYVDVPLVIGPLVADGVTEYEFVFTDSQNPNCGSFVELDPVSCGNTCEIDDLVVETECLPNGGYEAWVDFEAIHPNNLFYDVWLNNDFYGFFPIDSLPLHIPNFPTNPGPNDVLKICINDNPNCCAILEFPVPDCSGNTCEIDDLVVETECLPNGGYEAWVDFEAINPNNQFYDVWLNNDFYGFFPIDSLPLHIPNFPTNLGLNDVVKICINDNPNCCAILEFPVPDCSGNCEIFDLNVQATPCICGQFFALVSFEYNNVGTDGFDILGNGQHYGNFPYNHTQPIIIGPLTGDGMTNFEFIVQDHQTQNCIDEFELGTILCGPTPNTEPLNAKLQITCSPNPVLNSVHFTLSNTESLIRENIKIYMYASDGKEVFFQEKTAASNFTLDVSHLKSGHYRTVCRSGKTVWQGEFVKY